MKEPMEQYKPAEKLELTKIEKVSPKTFKKICCPSCSEEVAADHLNLQKSVAKCGSCNVIFSIEQEVESIMTKKDIKQEMFRPEGIDMFFYKENLDITIQQHIQGLDLYGLILLPTFAFLSTLVFFGEKHVISPLLPIVFFLGSLFFIYRGLNYSKNKSYIDVNDKFLTIKSRPKNFKKDKSYATDEIDQLYLKTDSDGLGYFTIHMIINGLQGQKHEKLITVNTISKAKYLEQEIERYLNIENRKVPEANV